MDRECVSLLPGVCDVLADSDKCLPDDTSLEKLLDWFSELTAAGVSLLKTCPCLLKFISTVTSNAASDPSVVSFALKLTGLTASTEDGFTVLQKHTALDRIFSPQYWREAGLWEDPCIRSGWIQGLQNMLQHPAALRFFVQSGFVKALLQLQTDTSLFVASAANQTVAHILLSFQSVSSTTCHESSGEDGDGEPISIKAPLSQPVLTMATGAGYSAVLTTVSEYLKDSLVPRGHTQLHQSLQILKLLALLLSQGGPPLQKKMLQVVAGSLEELVTGGYSQLTQTVMDVIMAAHSSFSLCMLHSSSSGPADCVVHQSTGRLLSSMLTVNKPADLVQAAAAFLHRGCQDTVNTAQAVRLLLLPLDIITGLTLLASADEHRLSMTEQLKTKTSCISVVCVCLRNAPQIAQMPDGVLPCPPGLTVLAVVSLLRICSGDTSSSGCSQVVRNVIDCGKVQKCALEALMCLSSSPGASDKMKDVFILLLHYLDSPDSDATVLDKSYKALGKWMSVCTDTSLIRDQLRPGLTAVVKKRVCDLRWEVRDSTVEFLGQLMSVAPEALPSACCTTPLLQEALQDPESYVRASAVSSLAHSWQQEAASPQEQADVVRRLLEILREDTEGFARRAVVRFFIAWFSSRSSHTPLLAPSSSSSSSLLMTSVRSVLSHGSDDLDWEVKVLTLELAELVLLETFSGHLAHTPCSDLQHGYAGTHTAGRMHVDGVQSELSDRLNTLVEQGVLSLLLSGLVDCDRPVGLKACRLLMTLRDTVCPLLLRPSAAVATRVSCHLPTCGWGSEIGNILSAKESDISAQSSFGEAEEVGEKRVCVSVCEVLTSLGLDERLAVLTQSSDHVHNCPRSLLQDILSASAAHTSPNTQVQEVIVDCY